MLKIIEYCFYLFVFLKSIDTVNKINNISHNSFWVDETSLQWSYIYPQLSVFASIPPLCCILISHLSTMPVSAAPVLSAKGHSGPPSRVHTFSREINGLSLQSLPLSFFVICRHWLGGCLQKVNTHSDSYGDWRHAAFTNSEICGRLRGCKTVQVKFFFVCLNLIILNLCGCVGERECKKSDFVHISIGVKVFPFDSI